MIACWNCAGCMTAAIWRKPGATWRRGWRAGRSVTRNSVCGWRPTSRRPSPSSNGIGRRRPHGAGLGPAPLNLVLGEICLPFPFTQISGTLNTTHQVFRVSLQSFRVEAVRNQKCSEFQGIFDLPRRDFVQSCCCIRSEFGKGDSRNGLPARSLASTMVEDSVR